MPNTKLNIGSCCSAGHAGREGLAYTRQFNYLWKRGFARAHQTPLATGLRIQGPGELHSVTLARQYRRKTESLRRSRSANIFLQGIYNCIIEEEPFAPVKYIYCSVHSRVRTVQLFVINNIFQLCCNFILRLYVPQMQQLEYMLRKH